MAERRLHGLQRVLGVNALFSTAYGNVGSSIYYALGLVASYALGLTPVVFLITGVFFFCTAATYAEATAMFPEAGGSSSFARRAFNEFVSFFAAWAQMLNYTVTIAISAYFVPHYIGGLFWEPLRSAPGDIIVGAIVIAILCVINVLGAKESAGLNIALAVVDFLTQVLLVLARRLPRALAVDARRERRPRHRADVDAVPARDPRRDDRLHRHRDDLEHGRGGQGRGQDDPGGDQPRADRGVRHLLHAARRSRSARCRCPSTPRAASTSRCSASRRTRAATRATRSSAS